MKPALTLVAAALFFCEFLSAATGPIALWPGDGDARDAIGTNHGVTVGGTAYAPGIALGASGQAFDFNGSNAEVRVPPSGTFNFSQGLTVAGWMRTSGSADFSGLVDKFVQGALVTGFQVSLSGNSLFPPNQPGILRADLGVGTTYVTAFHLAKVNDGQPHHFALTCDHQQAILYVDGMPGTPVTVTGWLPNNSEDLVFGRDTVLSDRYFTGQLDELALYGRALTPREIQALAGQPVLDIAKTGSDQVTISWPVAVSGFRLQINDGLAPAGWTDAPSGTNNPVTVPTVPQSRLFRLIRP